MRNDGKRYENEVYQFISRAVEKGQFIVSQPYVKVEKGKKYYSRDRDDYIQVDVSIEKYFFSLDDPSPALIIIVECKDYKNSVTVDDVEELHAKLQQIGEDNTKGILVTRRAGFQKSAVSFAKAKGITLAELDFDENSELIALVVSCRPNHSYSFGQFLWSIVCVPLEMAASLWSDLENYRRERLLIKLINGLLQESKNE